MRLLAWLVVSRFTVLSGKSALYYGPIVDFVNPTALMLSSNNQAPTTFYPFTSWSIDWTINCDEGNCYFIMNNIKGDTKP